MKKKRSEALHTQLPPANSIDRLKTKVNEKNKAANSPSKIGRMFSPPPYNHDMKVHLNKLKRTNVYRILTQFLINGGFRMNEIIKKLDFIYKHSYNANKLKTIRI